ncbi:NUDIX hydrolase [Breoghania sp.]|uniref:NUDIX hydrolase n=1 Tax=Breoghania sp. TaxID=2065378 RepID=UPI002AA94457|nr:NUDIX hydrolase [Breoghania sp.]
MNTFFKVLAAAMRPSTLPPAPKMKRKQQYGALPVRLKDGKLEVLLITSRGTGRWIIPKGWPKKQRSPHKLALLEAYEEAGIRGKIERLEIGHYDYIKWIDEHHSVACRVGVFVMKVRDVLNKWPEMHERTRRWVSPEEASQLVDEPQLSALLAGLHAKKITQKPLKSA